MSGIQEDGQAAARRYLIQMFPRTSIFLLGFASRQSNSHSLPRFMIVVLVIQSYSISISLTARSDAHPYVSSTGSFNRLLHHHFSRRQGPKRKTPKPQQ